ncbi:MAG TPA: hypothetical protein VGC97_23635 [Pyrinomonadaceae bacterium]
MAINSNILQRPSDRGLFLATAIAFPLVVLAGYFKSYYFSALFADARPVANALVHAHGIVMSSWVIYFIAQVALIRTKNIRLHMSMGMAGIALAALVVVVGMATAYDAQLVRRSAPPGADPHGFFFLPFFDMLLFVVFFAGAIYYRKRPAEHKSLMLLTAINFMPAALFRISPVAPENTIFWAFGVPAAVGVACFAWYTAKRRKLNKVFALGILLLLAAVPIRLVVPATDVWLRFTGWLAP